MSKKAKGEQKKVGGPFLAAAVFCDSIMEDAGGKISILGVSDGCCFYLPHDAPPDVPSKEEPALLQQSMVLSFRTGDSPGKHELRIMIEMPDGERKEAIQREIELSEPLHGGCNIKTQAALSLYTSGVYWFDVYLDGKRFTRMPFNVAFQRLTPPTQSPAKGVAKRPKKPNKA
jgi:hypothetical protein